MERSSPSAPKKSGLLEFRSGGWVLVLAGLLVLGAIVWRVAAILPTLSSPAIGDGSRVETYGFDLSSLLVPRDTLAAAGLAKDGLRALIDPPHITIAEMNDLRLGRSGFMVSGDRVVGITLNGESRAYPLRLLYWCEVVNDTLGGRPIAVTYNPLCDSAVVFDRRVGQETLTFGVSGLLCNSNLLLYDRRPQGKGESLWSQLQARAIAGPAAAESKRLDVLPMVLGRWRDWIEAHPDSTVLKPDPAKTRVYKLEPYNTYFADDHLHFPVDPLPPDKELALKTATVAIRPDREWRVFSVPWLVAQSNDSGTWRASIDGRPFEFRSSSPPQAVTVHALEGPDVPTIYSFWFAWYSLHPESREFYSN